MKALEEAPSSKSVFFERNAGCISGQHLRRPFSSRLMAWLLRTADVVAFLCCFEFFFWLRSGGALLISLGAFHTWIATGILIASLYLLECYAVQRDRPRWILPLRCLMAIGLAGVGIAAISFMLGSEVLPNGYNAMGRLVLLPALMIFAVYALISRFAIQAIAERRSSAIRWLVIGKRDDECIAHFWRSFDRQRLPGELVLLADDRLSPVEGEAAAWSQLTSRLEERWSGVILVGGWTMPDQVIEQLMHARLQGLRIFDLGEFYERFWLKVPIYHLHHGWFATTTGFSLLHHPEMAKVKRLMDILFASLLLILALPAMAAVAIAVKLISPGPVLFRQTRIGLKEAHFDIYKFRSMRIDAESGGAQWAAKADPRVTSIGKLLRKTRLDELPQLWNIMRGDMSFIGPRPERPEFTCRLNHEIPFYALRHLVKPGLTGWAQVNYQYGASIDDAREKLEYDLYYLKNHSFILDFVIILRTVKVVLFGHGAR